MRYRLRYRIFLVKELLESLAVTYQNKPLRQIEQGAPSVHPAVFQKTCHCEPVTVVLRAAN